MSSFLGRGAFAIVLLVAACAGAPPASTGPTVSPVSTPSATAAATTVPVSTPKATATPNAPTGFDGVWASRPLTKDMMVAAMAAHGLDTTHFDELFPDSNKIDYRMAEAKIGGGRWDHFEYEDGVWTGAWSAGIASANAGTIVVTADDNPCNVTFHLTPSGGDLHIAVGEDDCPDDLALEVALYEAAPFTLVQAADWKPAAFVPSAPIASRPSTSGQRLVAKPTGTVLDAPLGYLEYLPPGYSAGGDKSPLLLFFHGSGESGAGDAIGMSHLRNAGIPDRLANNRWPDDLPFVVLSPQHDDSVPPDFCMQADEIDAFIKFALGRYNVDPNRVYLTGLSCGAIGIWNYLGKYGGDAIAAAIPIAGNGLIAIQNRGCELGSTPIWAFHGALDGNVPVRGEVYPLTFLQGCTNPSAVDAKLTVYPLGEHDVWTQTYGGSDGIDIYSWLLGHELAH